MEVTVEQGAVQPKARFIGNISADRVVIPDLKNSIDETGLTLNPGEKIDLTQYYSAEEINRSRGLDSAIKGVIGPDQKEVMPVVVKVLDSMDEVIKPAPLPLAADPINKGNAFEAPDNYADDNLDRLEEREEKEFEKIQAGNRGARKRRNK